MSIGPRFIAFPALVFVIFLTDCALQTTTTPGTSPGVSLSGNVQGCQQAVIGAHVHLLAASVTGYGTESNSLLTTGTDGSDAYGGYVLIDSGGAFSVTGEYACVAGTT